MSDPLSMLRIGEVHCEHQTVRQARTARVLAAYRANIALEDLTVCRFGDMTPIKVIGQDGQELTPERRAEMFRGRQLYDEHGNKRDINYIEVNADLPDTDWAIHERFKHPIRIVQPKELELTLTLDTTTLPAPS